jgi:uncharacterized membrane protein YfcA
VPFEGFDVTTWITLAPIVLLASFVFQAVGFGAGLVAVPLATIFLDPKMVLPVLALLELVNSLRLLRLSHGGARLAEALPLILFSGIGTAVGVGLLVNLPIGWLMIGMAAFIGTFLVHQQRGASNLPTHTVSRAWVLPTGLASGIGSAMFGMGGPPYLIYLHLRGLPFEAWRATAVLVGLFSLIWRITGFTSAGLYARPGILILSISLLPSALIAIWLAERVKPRLDERLLRRCVQVLLALASLTLLLRGVGALRP